MGTATLILLALGLAMDATAASVANGVVYQNVRAKDVLTYAALFGLFQAGMPAAGYLAGRGFSGLISSLDHWIALILLGFLGGKMIWESIRQLRQPEQAPEARRLTMKIMLTQAVATSIDALAVGVGFAVMQVNIAVACLSIGLITFGCSLAGSWLGRRFGQLLGRAAEIFGGLILVVIGLNIFVEHVFG